MQKIIFVVLACLIMAVPSFADEVQYPQPKGFVNDFVGAMHPKEIQKLESRLRAYEKETTVEIAVAIVDLPKDTEIAQYAFNLKSKWRVGKKETNNGLLLLVVPKATAKRVFIAQGSDLQGVLPDLQNGRISDGIDSMMRSGEYGAAITSGVEGIIKSIGNAPAEQKMKERLIPKKEDDGNTNIIIGSIALTVVVLFYWLIYRWRSRKKIDAPKKNDIEEEDRYTEQVVTLPMSFLSSPRGFSRGAPTTFVPSHLARTMSHENPSPIPHRVKPRIDEPVRRVEEESDDGVGEVVALAAGALMGSILSGDESAEGSPREEPFHFGGDDEITGAGAGSSAVVETQTDESATGREDTADQQQEVASVEEESDQRNDPPETQDDSPDTPDDPPDEPS